MDTIIKEWRELLRDFKESVDRNVQEIRKCKEAVHGIRPDYADHQVAGRFIRSKDPIIISSPNIIIGNVDADGNLLGGAPGRIVLRGTNIDLEGVGTEGEAGSVVTRATSIRQIAVDPGMDGLEAVVMPESQIISQARHISIDSCSDSDVFINNPSAVMNGVSISSDTMISIDSSLHLNSRTERLNELTSSLDQLIGRVQQDVNRLDGGIDAIFEQMDRALSDADTLKFDNKEISSKVGLLDDLRQECESATIVLNDKVRELVTAISKLAEAKRQKAAVDAMKRALPAADDYKKDGSGTVVLLNSDLIAISTRNGNGESCENDGAGVFIDTREVMVNSQDSSGALMAGSNFTVYSEKIEFNATESTYSDEGKTKGESKSVGTVNVYAKDVNIKSVDSQFDAMAQNEADKHKETAVTKDSKLSVRVSAVDFSTVGTNGVADGSVNINSKLVSVFSGDLDKDNGGYKKMNDEGQIILGAKSIFAGLQDDKLKTAKVQILSNETVMESKSTVSIKQGGDGNIVMKDGSASMTSKKNTLTGETEINGTTKFNAAIDAPDGKIGNLEVTGEFKSKALSDGFKAPAAGGSKKAVDPVESVKPAEVKPEQSEIMGSVRASDGNGKVVVIVTEDKK